MRRGGATMGELADLAAVGARLARGLPVSGPEAARFYRAHRGTFRAHGLREADVVAHGAGGQPPREGVSGRERREEGRRPPYKPGA